MKKIYIILLVLSISFSCTDMLEQINPTGPTGDDFFANETELGYAVTSVYAGLSSTNLYGSNLSAIERLSDNCYQGSASTDGAMGPWTNFTFDASNDGIRLVYQELYITINRANIVLAKASDVPGVDPNALKDIFGQVSFIRAYSYFMLTMLYGDVPIVLEPTDDPAGTSVAKSTAGEIYDLIISDLKVAANDCVDIASEKGKITSWMAKSMLAKVYLFGADELNRQEWYAIAEGYAEEVIQSETYSLYNDSGKTPTENLLEILALGNETKIGKEYKNALT